MSVGLKIDGGVFVKLLKNSFSLARRVYGRDEMGPLMHRD